LYLTLLFEPTTSPSNWFRIVCNRQDPATHFSSISIAPKMGSISRLTLFKLSNPADQDAAIAGYAKMFNDHSRVSHRPPFLL
jgi:hypothetical protein